MKSILLSGAAAALLIAASGAYAQQDDHQAGHPDAGAHGDAQPGGDTHMSGPADQHGATGNHNAMGGDDHRDNTTTTTHTTRRTHHTRNGTTTNTNRTTDTTRDDNNRNNNTARDNRGHHAQIDVKLRIAVTATRHFHAPAYRAPPGYAYRRYNIGERLEPNFYARDYWLADYATYQLVAPPDGYTWIRFGPDAMLIDEDSGEVVQVQYGIFD